MTKPMEQDLSDARVLWAYHRLDDPLSPSDVLIGLGSHDIGVAEHTARLWLDGLAPLIVFTGANAPTTVDRFPRGEAVHYRERALELGVPDSAILVEPKATNTGENAALVRELLTEHAVVPATAIVVSRPYQQRRARATFRKVWPELQGSYTAAPTAFDEYLATIGDPEKVINMLVGDTQRIGLYARTGFAAPDDDMPEDVHRAFSHLVQAGFTTRIARS